MNINEICANCLLPARPRIETETRSHVPMATAAEWLCVGRGAFSTWVQRAKAEATAQGVAVITGHTRVPLRCVRAGYRWLVNVDDLRAALDLARA